MRELNTSDDPISSLDSTQAMILINHPFDGNRQRSSRVANSLLCLGEDGSRHPIKTKNREVKAKSFNLEEDCQRLSKYLCRVDEATESLMSYAGVLVLIATLQTLVTVVTYIYNLMTQQFSVLLAVVSSTLVLKMMFLLCSPDSLISKVSLVIFIAYQIEVEPDIRTA